VAYDEVLAQARAWVRRSRAQGLFAPPSNAQRDAFWQWCDALHQPTAQMTTGRVTDKRSACTLNRCVSEVLRRGPDCCLAHLPEAAALVPEAIREGPRWKHSPMVTGWVGGIVRHQMLGVATSVQGVPEQLRGSHLLLLQLGSDPGLDWMWGDVGVLQYWIAPDDLAARRFDRVAVTVEGH